MNHLVRWWSRIRSLRMIVRPLQFRPRKHLKLRPSHPNLSPYSLTPSILKDCSLARSHRRTTFRCRKNFLNHPHRVQKILTLLPSAVTATKVKRTLRRKKKLANRLRMIQPIRLALRFQATWDFPLLTLQPAALLVAQPITARPLVRPLLRPQISPQKVLRV